MPRRTKRNWQNTKIHWLKLPDIWTVPKPWITYTKNLWVFEKYPSPSQVLVSPKPTMEIYMINKEHHVNGSKEPTYWPLIVTSILKEMLVFALERLLLTQTFGQWTNKLNHGPNYIAYSVASYLNGLLCFFPTKETHNSIHAHYCQPPKLLLFINLSLSCPTYRRKSPSKPSRTTAFLHTRGSSLCQLPSTYSQP